jgi:DNA-binding transcriptional regulator YhcF (GntR family)
MAKGKSKRFATLVLDKPIEIVDPLTGEVREATRIVVPYGYKDKNFCKVYYHTIQRLTELPKSCQKVFDWLLKNMDFENKVYVPNLRELAETLGLAHITVKKAMSKLQKQGFVRKVNTALYMINPQLACKTADNRDLYIRFVNVEQEDYEEFIERAAKAAKSEKER